jgi:branched-subunit amino acid aminotransferase/4-amino-4-deoxychorismate lyase
MSIREDVAPDTLRVDLTPEGVAVEYLDGREVFYRGVPEKKHGSVRCGPGKDVHVLVTDGTGTQGVLTYVNDRQTRADILEDTGVGRVITANLLSKSSPDPGIFVDVLTRLHPAEWPNRPFKSSTGLTYIRARMEARDQGGEDALMLTTDGYVSETTIANIFWIKNDIIYTPNLECDLLPGITRGILTSIIRDLDGVNLVKGQYRIEKVYESDAAWVCNSLREVRPVESIEDHPLDTEHPVFDQLREAVEEYKKRHLISIRES